MKSFLNIGADIETIPCQSEEFIEKITFIARAKNVTPPSSYNKEDFGKALGLDDEMVKSMTAGGLKAMWIDRFRGEAVEDEFQKLHRETSFSAGRGGEVISCSFKVFGTGPDGVSPLMPEPVTVFRARDDGTTETELLVRVVNWLNKMKQYADSQGSQIRFVGANILGFDFRFMAQRMLMLGLALPSVPMIASKYDRTRFYDVLDVWSFSDPSARVSLSLLCKLLDIPTPKSDAQGEIDGSKVWDVWRDGGMEGAQRIASYNARDAAVLEPIFNKLIALEGE